MARDDRFKKYQAAGAELLEDARARAEEFVRELAKLSDTTQKQAQEVVDELVGGSRKGTEHLFGFITNEVATQLAQLGLTSRADLEALVCRLMGRVAPTESAPATDSAPATEGADPTAAPAATKVPGQKAAPATKKTAPATKKARAAKAPAAKATAKKAPATKAPAAKATAATKVTAKKAPATKAAAATKATANKAPAKKAAAAKKGAGGA